LIAHNVLDIKSKEIQSPLDQKHATAGVLLFTVTLLKVKEEKKSLEFMPCFLDIKLTLALCTFNQKTISIFISQ
jgi:hypothetical protein